MKRIRRVICFFFLVSPFIKAQGVIEGDETITPYYGPAIPIFESPFMYNNGFGSGLTNYKTNSIGTFGISSEHLFSDVVGFGIDMYYTKSETSWTQTVEEYNSVTGLYDQKTYDYKVSAPTLAALARLNLHYANYFSMFSDEFDSYCIIAIGYKKVNYKVSTQDPNYVLSQHRPLFYVIDPTLPIGIKLGAGFRYFVTEETAITCEVVLGKPYISGGLTFRF